MSMETCSAERLAAICLEALRPCEGFEDVVNVSVQRRERMDGGANWSVMSVTPKVSNVALRGARSVLDGLQAAYRLPEGGSEAVVGHGARKGARAAGTRRTLS